MKPLRSLIPSLGNKYYFNYGGQGPLPTPSLEEIMQSWKTIQELGPFTEKVWPYISKEIIYTKQILSTDLGVPVKNIALTENITTGMILPLSGMRFDNDDEIVISDCEHPGIVAAVREFCKKKKIGLKIFPIQEITNLNDDTFIDAVKRNIDINTKALIISHILWNYGYEIPLKELSEELNTFNKENYLLVDGAQSFGHIKVSELVKYSDLYAITSHKWACGPEGLGAVYVSDKFLKLSSPTIIGWKSLKREQGIYEPYQDLFHEDARKFEIATTCIPLLAGLRKSILLLKNDISEDKKIQHIRKLSNHLISELSQFNNVKSILKEELTNGIVSFDIKNISDKNKILKELGKKDIWIRVVEDPKWFRVCIHQFTTQDEIDLLIREIQKLIT